MDKCKAIYPSVLLYSTLRLPWRSIFDSVFLMISIHLPQLVGCWFSFPTLISKTCGDLPFDKKFWQNWCQTTGSCLIKIFKRIDDSGIQINKHFFDNPVIWNITIGTCFSRMKSHAKNFYYRYVHVETTRWTTGRMDNNIWIYPRISTLFN